MSERKVLNKYFPPNFDPSKIPRQKRPKDLQHKVRLMAPFSMRCESCGEYIHKGKKFNARKETVEGEMYLGIKIFRFYIRCPRCSAEITFKTDPKNTDYVAEHGASRNFEPWRDTDDNNEEEEEEAGEDPMAALENRTLDSKREMEILDALDEIRLRNARSERVDVNEVLQRFSFIDKDMLEERLKQEEEEIEKQANEAFQSADGERVRKLADGEEPDVFSLVASTKAAMGKPAAAAAAAPTPTPTPTPTLTSSSLFSKPKLPLVTKRKTEQQLQLGIAVKRKVDKSPSHTPAGPPKKEHSISKSASAPPPPSSGLSLLASYDDSEEDDD